MFTTNIVSRFIISIMKRYLLLFFELSFTEYLQSTPYAGFLRKGCKDDDEKYNFDCSCFPQGTAVAWGCLGGNVLVVVHKNGHYSLTVSAPDFSVTLVLGVVNCSFSSGITLQILLSFTMFETPLMMG